MKVHVFCLLEIFLKKQCDMFEVAIIEDYDVIKSLYEKIINTTDEFKVIGSFSSCEEALTTFRKNTPDIVLLDITLPGMNGIEGIPLIKELLPNVIIIVNTIHENSKYVFDALKAGAIGYITKSSGEEKILQALKEAVRGGSPMSTRIARMVIQSFQQNTLSNLTKQENIVLENLAKGKTYNAIADQLCISLNTIKFHIKNIYGKLQVTNREEAIGMLNRKNSLK